ncbi:MAG: CapA family protein [Polyangiaceae bacterium]|nr:CapA family protein [Polyangiaceae bacterium]
MTARGIDQILPCPSEPWLCEPYMHDAREYIKLAERANGPIARPVDFGYVWGDALEQWAKHAPDVRIVNLETSITTSNDACPKGINYRMHPNNVPCLLAANIDCCALANNHVIDWGLVGLADTLASLHDARIATAGAGRNRDEAESPAILELPGRCRVLIFSYGSVTSGVPLDWEAGAESPGIAVLENLGQDTIERVKTRILAAKRPGDIVIVSIHWGDNWGYDISRREMTFAHALVDEAGVDVIHGHSSHHPKPIEVHSGRPIFYGCGDFLNDYEGIHGHEEYRSDLTLMYFVRIEVPTGKLIAMTMVPLCMRRFRLERATRSDARWLAEASSREGSRFGTRVVLGKEDTLVLEWR